jgi:hypothetical protein
LEPPEKPGGSSSCHTLRAHPFLESGTLLGQASSGTRRLGIRDASTDSCFAQPDCRFFAFAHFIWRSLRLLCGLYASFATIHRDA